MLCPVFTINITWIRLLSCKDFTLGYVTEPLRLDQVNTTRILGLLGYLYICILGILGYLDT